MDKLNIYQREQLEALHQVKNRLQKLDGKKRAGLEELIQPYLEFREKLHLFLTTQFGKYCTQACFNSQSSACCSKDGIITFWADHVINACCCTEAALDGLAASIQNPLHKRKCIYLGANGCLWKVTPVVCAMFVCDQALSDTIHQDPELNQAWERYQVQAKAFRWPDKPVLFDLLEEMFIEMGCQSPLMYINSSPGLRQIKKKAGLLKCRGSSRHSSRHRIQGCQSEK